MDSFGRMDMKKLTLTITVFATVLMIDSIAQAAINRSPASAWPTGLAVALPQLASIIPAGVRYPHDADPWDINNEEDCDLMGSSRPTEKCHVCWRSKIVSEVEHVSTKAEHICLSNQGSHLTRFKVELRGGEETVGNKIEDAIRKTFSGVKTTVENGVNYWITKTRKIGLVKSSRTTVLYVEPLNDPTIPPEGGICTPEEVAGNFQCGAFGMPWLSKKSDVLKALGVSEDSPSVRSSNDGQVVRIEGAKELTNNITVVDPGLTFNDQMRLIGAGYVNYNDEEVWGEHAMSSQKMERLLELNNVILDNDEIGTRNGDVIVDHFRDIPMVDFTYMPR
jgi:hypothetical protein